MPIRLIAIAGIGALALMLASVVLATERPGTVDDRPTYQTFVAIEPDANLSNADGPISEEQARLIGGSIAALKGDGNALLTSIERMTISEAVREHSPGAEIYGWSTDMGVFVLTFVGGPFDLVRSVPINRPESAAAFSTMYVVIAAETGEVIGVGH